MDFLIMIQIKTLPIDYSDHNLTTFQALLHLLAGGFNYKNSEIVGQVITNDYPTKPKKKLIVAVAFIAGFILSIFLVFIINAFRKEDDKATA
jgi:uncharacterized protein involved in exopolysaccharide biosynthesis